MIRRILKGPEDDETTEAIINELDDDPDKLYVWSLPNWEAYEVDEFRNRFPEYFVSDHIFVAGETVVSDVDEERLREAVKDVVDKDMVVTLIEENMEGMELRVDFE